VEGSGQIHAPSALLPTQEPTALTEYEWVGSGDGLDAFEERNASYICRN